MQIGKILTVAVVVLGLSLAISFIYTNYLGVQDSYNGSLKYSISKQTPGYDYSCDEPEYPVYLVISNNGTKTVADFSVSVSNPLCVGAVPPLSGLLLPSQRIEIYLYSTQQNGTLTISGNNTLFGISF